MITSNLDDWIDEYPDRKWVAVIDMSDVPRAAYYQVNRGFGNEFMVLDPSRAKGSKSCIPRGCEADRPELRQEFTHK